MNRLLTGIDSLLQNKHTSGAALAFFALGAAGVIWPSAKAKCDEIGKLAVLYGLLAAGDAKKES